jgi:hypothetical protein
MICKALVLREMIWKQNRITILGQALEIHPPDDEHAYPCAEV